MSEEKICEKPKSKMANVQFRHRSPRARTNSFKAFEDMLQCGICLDRLTDARMLPCQHTFCLHCLLTKVDVKPSNENEPSFIFCPYCKQKIPLINGRESFRDLPKNMYIDCVYGLLNDKAQVPVEKQCEQCKTIADDQEICSHCEQSFCRVCWNEHLSELKLNLDSLLKQLRESESRLVYKLKNFNDRLDQLNETVKNTIKQEIYRMKTAEAGALEELEKIKDEGLTTYENIEGRLQDLSNKILTNSWQNKQVTTFMNMHRETSKLLTEINQYGEARLFFDPTKLTLDKDTEGIYNDVGDYEATDPKSRKDFKIDVSVNTMTDRYKRRSFKPKIHWTKCPRPAGVGIPPWDPSKLLIAATDSHSILLMERNEMKLIKRWSHEEMLFPCSLAFSASQKLIYVSDKWKHCIHILSAQGIYIKSICQGKLHSPDGIATINQDLIVCDTGNDRVIIVDQNGTIKSTLGAANGKTEFYMPTGIAVYRGQIIVADSGNHRIKVFDSKEVKVLEFGSLGRHHAQFRSAETVAVDPYGFILVGDAGNARIQVFAPDGTLVKIFGSKEGFRWISGIFVTPELDIIATDYKMRSLKIF